MCVNRCIDYVTYISSLYNLWCVRVRVCKSIHLLLQALPEEKRSELQERELWVEANFTQYKREQEDEMKSKLASSGKYKMYR